MSIQDTAEQPPRYRPGGYGAMVEDEQGPYVRHDALGVWPVTQAEMLARLRALADAATLAIPTSRDSQRLVCAIADAKLLIRRVDAAAEGRTR
jgi:ribonuclease HI